MPLSTASPARSPFRNPAFVGLLGSSVALGLAFSFVSPFLSIWGTQRIGFTPVQFSVFMTAVTLSAITVSTVLAGWSDRRVSRRTMLLLGSGAGVLGYAGYAIVLNPWALTLIGLTLVATTSICFSQLFAHVREVYVAAPIEGRSGQSAFAISLVRVCFSVAWTGGPAAAAAVLAVLGFHGLFLSAAGLYLLFFLGVCRFVPPVAPPAPPPGNVPMSMGQALAQRDLLACFLAFAAVFAAHALNLVSLPLFFTTALGGSTRDLGIVFCIGPLTELPLMLWFGRCSTRTGRFRLIQWGMAVTVLYFAALLMASQPWHVFPVQMLNGVSFAILSNVGIMFFQDLRPGRAGLATSVFANASNGGNLVGFLLFGVGFELAGYRGLQTGCALLSLLALLLLRQVRGMAAAVD